MVLDSLVDPHFEPLDQTDLEVLSAKMALLLALALAKGVGDFEHCRCTLPGTSTESGLQA